MGDLLNSVATTWSEFQSWVPPTSMLYPMLALSIVCAFIISFFTSTARLFAVPVGFMILMFASTFSNFLGRDVFVGGITELQKTIVLTILGNCIAAIIVLAIFRASDRK